MFNHYLITGATGFLGRALVNSLLSRGIKVTALVMPGDPLAAYLSERVQICTGDITSPASLREFFSQGGKNSCCVHCAGMISIASNPGNRITKINVEGTANIIELCKEYHIGKLIYVSSVHALPETPAGQPICEVSHLSPDAVFGAYGKSKAAATQLILDAAGCGLNASVVHPSGIIGPGDLSGGNMSQMLTAFCQGSLPVGVRGGYDFVDVRDVAEGIISCAECGRAGECYILSGHYLTIRQLLTIASAFSGLRSPRYYIPLSIAKLLAPAAEAFSLRRQKTPYFTPYSISVLGSNGLFSHKKAAAELGYSPRPASDTLKDTMTWLLDRYPRTIPRERPRKARPSRHPRSQSA